LCMIGLDKLTRKQRIA